jgi:hypothetical protein
VFRFPPLPFNPTSFSPLFPAFFEAKLPSWRHHLSHWRPYPSPSVHKSLFGTCKPKQFAPLVRFKRIGKQSYVKMHGTNKRTRFWGELSPKFGVLPLRLYQRFFSFIFYFFFVFNIYHFDQRIYLYDYC